MLEMMAKACIFIGSGVQSEPLHSNGHLLNSNPTQCAGLSMRYMYTCRLNSSDSGDTIAF